MLFGRRRTRKPEAVPAATLAVRGRRQARLSVEAPSLSRHLQHKTNRSLQHMSSQSQHMSSQSLLHKTTLASSLFPPPSSS